MKTFPTLSQHEKIAALRAGGLHCTSDEVLDHVAAACTTRCFLRGEQINRQAEQPDGISWVFSGTVRMCQSSPNGREITISSLRGKGAFGVTATLDGLPFAANAHAESAVMLAFLPRPDLLRLLEEFPQLYAPLMAMMCDKLRQALTVVEALACLRLEVRLARRLLALAAPCERGDDAGVTSLATSQGELSRMLGASRQSINKHLQGWQTLGLIKIERRRLWIQDPEALRRIE